MLDGFKAHIFLLASRQVFPLLTAGTPQQYICIDSVFPRRSHPVIPPHPLFPLPSLQATSNNMSTSKEARYAGKAEVFNAPQP